MSALQGQVNRWFTDNPNATGQQVVAAIQSIGGLNAHAGLADILAARYGVAPNEVQNYYNTYATPPAAAAPTAVASTGLVNNFGNSQAVSNAYLSSLGRPASESEIQWWLSNHSSIGNIQSGIAGSAEAQGRASNAAQPAPAAPVAQPAYFAANPDVAAAFKENSYGLTPEQFAQTHFEKFGVNEQRAAPTAVSAPTSTPKSMPANYDQAYVNQLVREAAQQAGGTLSFTDVSNAAKNLGISPEMVNRALSTGVITGAGTPAYEQIVRDAYASIGRTGIGTAASNIDQAGFDGWVQSLQRGDSTPEAFQRNFQTAVADYLARNPEDKYSTYVTDFLSRTKPAAVSGIVDLYRDVLGRDPDPQGLGDWYRLFGEEISPEERAQFEQSAAAEKYGSVPDSVYSTYKTIYGVEPDAETLAQLKNRFGPTFDANEISQYVADDTSLRDDPRGVVKTLQQQILDQGTTQYWSGEGFGSAEKNAADMARMLATAGITNINQFGVRQVERPGEPLYYDDNGTPTAYSEPRLVSEYYNKETGVALDPRYDRAQGNIFSGTFAGNGSTGYGVQFREDGTPVFYTQFGGSTNTLKQITDDLGPMGQIALAVATGGLSIPQQIAAQAALSLASGGDLKDIAKNIAVSLVMSKIPGSDLIKDGTKYLNSIDPSGVLGNAFKSAAASGTRAALTGKDIGDAILSGAVGGGTAGAIDFMAEGIDGFGNLTRSEQNMVKNAISGVVSGQPLDQVLINTAIQAGKDAIRTTTTGQGGITNRAVDDTIPQGDGTTNVLADAGLVTDGGKFAETNLTDTDLANIVGGGSTSSVALTGDRDVDRLIATIQGNVSDPTAGLALLAAAPQQAQTAILRLAESPVGRQAIQKAANQSQYASTVIRDALIASGLYTAVSIPRFLMQSGPLEKPDMQESSLVSQIPKGAPSAPPSSSMGESVFDPTFGGALPLANPTAPAARPATKPDYIVQPGDYSDTEEEIQPWQLVDPVSGKPLRKPSEEPAPPTPEPAAPVVVPKTPPANDPFNPPSTPEKPFTPPKTPPANDPEVKPPAIRPPPTPSTTPSTTPDLEPPFAPRPTPAPDTTPKTLPKPDAKPSPKPDAKPNAKPSPKPDAKPEVKPDVKPEARPNELPAPSPSSTPAPAPKPAPSPAPAPSPTPTTPTSHNPSIPVFVPTDPVTWPTPTEDPAFDPAAPETWPPVNPPPGEVIETPPEDTTPPVVTPPVVTPPKTTPTVPPSVVQKVARQLGVPATSQIAIDVAEALYGTMEYLDIGEEFKPSERKAKPAATQKQQQQTKMAQGGYLDAALAEEMSVDELLNLLR